MKATNIKILLTGFLLILFFSASVPYAVESPAADPKESPAAVPAPVAVMPETTFEFPPAMEGEKITHDFLIQNQGEAELNILKVQTT